jgi:UDPglucose 6-dehydrogenase
MKAQKITIVGTGYVGLVSGVCLAAIGHDVTCIDTNAAKIDGLKKNIVPIYEPGLDKLIEANVKAGRLHFSTKLTDHIKGQDALFIAVGTPTASDGISADLKYVFAVAHEIAPLLDAPIVIVTKSTVPVLSNKAIEEEIRRINPQAQFDICSNPEFLREGSAIDDFMKPDRIVVGVRNDRAKSVMQHIYQPLTDQNYPLVVTTPESAELIKYASNALLATKIAFINEVANLAEKTNGDINDVAKAVGMDSRIGPKFLQAGPGYGGSCFPKDTRAFAHMAKQHHVPSHIVESVIVSNETRKQSMAARIIAACNGSVKGKIIAILGVTFKANTDDMRDSVALDIIPQLLQAGAEIHAYDPAAEHQAHDALPKQVQWHRSAHDTFKDAAALVIVTEWPEFKTIDLKLAQSMMQERVIIDLRNLLDVASVNAHGFDYHCIGQQPLKAR